MRRLRGGLAALGLVLVVLLIRLLVLEAPPEEVEPGTVLVSFDPEDLREIAVGRPEGGFVLRRDGGAWQVVGQAWAPRRALVRRMVHQTHELVTRGLVDAAPANVGAYGLGPEAVQVELGLRDGTRRLLRLGRANATGVSHFAQVGGEPAVHLVARAAVAPFLTPLAEVREDRFAAVELGDVVGLEVGLDGVQFGFERLGPRAWQLSVAGREGTVAADHEQVALLIGRVANLRALRVEEAGEPPELGDDRIRLVLAGGRHVTVRPGAAVAGERPVLHEEASAVYMVKDGFLESFRRPLGVYEADP